MDKCHVYLFITGMKNKRQWLEFLEKIFGFLYLSLKLSLTLHHKGKMLWLSPLLNQQIFPDVENSSKMKFC